MATDKQLLLKGIKYLGFTALLMFIGPTLLYIVAGDRNTSVFIPLVIIAILICGFAIFLGFKGIRTVMKSIFSK
ncbi:DUF6095 family protein [Aegicerativicinus sediminis]|uniref:DUF6095 family protein n=1 Tax=Aegicerativicinus sediminis TaxID=2893202 RepID=UPI001E2EC8FB|nr:DUF6095 family protein [Aegicerativicinus sediminis]